MAAMQQSPDKTLAEVLANSQVLPSEYDVVINDLQTDSRKIQQGDLFIAIEGETVNGVDYIDAAIQSGAAAVLWDAPVDAISVAWSAGDRKIPLVAVNNLKQKLPGLAMHFYHSPSALLDIVTVTGTNGKTSCVNYIAQALLAAKNNCGLIGTLGMGVYPDILPGTHTTPDVLTVHKTLASFVKQGAGFAAIEVSSHALAQDRMEGVQVDTAIFTNLTQDHLDYHGTMEAYFKEKVKLFQWPSLKTAIINLDDPYGLTIANETVAKNVISYSLDKNKRADIYASDIQSGSDTTRFTLNTSAGCVQIQSNLMGNFNISNLLAVCAFLRTKEYSLESVAQYVKNIFPVAGRMQRIKADGFPLIVIDYAHTPDALEQALQTLSSRFEGNLCCVFGCGGERDKDKRKKMGAVANQYASKIILTNDNPRGEDAEAIIRQIISGISQQEKIQVELDRKKAIIEAIKNTDKNGCVLVAGKGHETYQIIGNKKTDFSDAAVVNEFLSK